MGKGAANVACNAKSIFAAEHWPGSALAGWQAGVLCYSLVHTQAQGQGLWRVVAAHLRGSARVLGGLWLLGGPLS